MADPITIPLAVSSDVWLPYTAGVVAKGTLLLAVVFATAAMLRRTSASARHLVWSIGLAAVLALPILSATLPLRFEVLPSGADRWNALVDGFGSPAHAGAAADRSTAGPDSRKSDEEEDDASTRGALAVASDAAPAERGGGGPLRITGESDPAPEVRGFDPEPTTSDAVAEGSNSSDLAATSGVGPGAAEHGDRPAAAERSGAGDRGAGVTPLLVLLGLWAAGALVLLGRMAVGSVAVRRIARRAEPPTSSAWTRPFYEAADRLDLERLPRLLIADAVPLPFTFGLLRPTIVLPGGARSWTDERRRAVLLHELGHIRRRDLWSHLVGRLACAVYWFHPLVWIAAGRARAESERACDDLVLRTGTRASSYADHLLQIVRGASRSRVPAAAIPMAQRNEFEGRMLAILEPDVPRESPGRAKSAALVVGVAALTLAVSAMAPASETAASAATESDDIVTAAGDAAAMVPRDEGEAARQEVPRATDPDRGGGSSIAPDEDATSPTAATDASTERPNADSGVASGVDETTPATPDPNAGTSRSDERARPADAGALAADTPTTTRRPIELRTGVHVESAMERAMAAAYAWADPDWIDDVVGHALDGAWSGLHGVAPAPVPEPRAFGFDDPLDLDFDFEVEQPERAVPLSSWNGRRAPADSATVRALIGALSDTEPEVRRIAAHGLGEIGDPAAVEALSRVLLEDDEATVRWMAALSLGEIEDPA
ncbi:MAG: M56 family metallopeptidase, partial [Gemmatimonadota bacterium]